MADYKHTYLEEKITDEGLKRVIGIPGFAASIINNTIGAGIFAIPAIVSMQMGAVGILGYLFCGLMLVTIMLCYVEIGSKINTSGGSYIYVETAFGPFAGFVINCLFLFGYGILSSAAVMSLMAKSIGLLFSVFSGTAMNNVLLFMLLGTMVLINVRGAKQSVNFLQYATIIKLIPLLGIIILGFSHIKAGNLQWQHFPSLKTSGETILVLFYAFSGFETSFNVSGEIEDSRRTIPLGILFGTLVVFVFYALIQTVTQGVLGAQISHFKDAPLAAVADNIIGPTGTTILLAAAIISCLGNTSGDVMATPRLLFAGANNGALPKMLGKVHPKFATPYIAIITYASLIFFSAISGGFRQLAVLASGCLLIIYLSVVLAMLKLRKRKPTATVKAFKVPGGIMIPLMAIAAIIWLLISLKSNEVISIIIFLMLIITIYFLMSGYKNRKARSNAD